jgi:hypothetical protein
MAPDPNKAVFVVSGSSCAFRILLLGGAALPALRSHRHNSRRLQPLRDGIQLHPHLGGRISVLLRSNSQSLLHWIQVNMPPEGTILLPIPNPMVMETFLPNLPAKPKLPLGAK